MESHTQAGGNQGPDSVYVRARVRAYVRACCVIIHPKECLTLYRWVYGKICNRVLTYVKMYLLIDVNI